MPGKRKRSSTPKPRRPRRPPTLRGGLHPRSRTRNVCLRLGQERCKATPTCKWERNRCWGELEDPDAEGCDPRKGPKECNETDGCEFDPISRTCGERGARRWWCRRSRTPGRCQATYGRFKYHNCPEVEVGTTGHRQCIHDRQRKTKRHGLPADDDPWTEEEDIPGPTERELMEARDVQRADQAMDDLQRELGDEWQAAGRWDPRLSEEENFGYLGRGRGREDWYA